MLHCFGSTLDEIEEARPAHRAARPSPRAASTSSTWSRKAAERAGVRHVVYTSLTNPGPESPIALAADHRSTEEALAASALGYTVLRNNLYAEVLLPLLGRAIASGQLVAAAGQGAVGYVTREDCARAAAAALRSPFTGRRGLDITGPELVSHAQLAALASELSGRPVRYVPTSREALEAGLLGAGLPPPLAAAFASFDEAIARGTLAVSSAAVTELTGRKPESVPAVLSARRAELHAQH
jgi:NAD(P)H dehydrogenase (quinone)